MATTWGTRWRKTGAAMLGLAVVLAGGACGDDESGSGSSEESTATAHTHDDDPAAHLPKTDPCTLVAKADAEGVLGPLSTITEGSASGGIYGVVPDSRVCRLVLASDGKFGANVGLTEHDAESKFKGMSKQFEKSIVEIDGVGDGAFWIPPFRALLALEGDALVSVQLLESNPNFDAPELKDKAVKLVNVALRGLSEK